MPLVRIDLREGRSAADLQAIGDAVHRAMVDTLNVPAADRFQVIATHPAGRLVYDPAYLDIPRTDQVVFIQVTLNAGRSVELKRAFYARTAALLAEAPGLRPEDVLINLVEVPRENWSFGRGEAQYAPPAS